MCVLSQSIRHFTFESSWPDAFSAHCRICFSKRQFVFGRFAEKQRGGVHGIGRGLVVLGVVGVVFVDPVEFLLQDADRRLADGLATLGLPERFLVLIERRRGMPPGWRRAAS